MPKVLLGIATYAVAIVMAVAVWSPQGTTETYAQESDPVAVVEALADAATETFTTGNGEPFANVFTEDGVFANRNDGFAIVGRPAMVWAFSDEPDETFSATLVSSEVDGNTVTGAAELVDQDTVDAGVPSHIELFTATVEDGLVSSFILTYDLTDPDTQTYYDYITSQEEEGNDEPLPGQVDIDLTGDQAGTASVAEFEEGVTLVAIGIDPGEEGAWQPAHIHTGTCEEPGGIVYPLAYPVDGFAFTILSASQADLLSHDYIVNVHLSEAEPGTYVSCGVLETADGGPGLPSTGTGGAQTKDSDSNLMTWLIVGLAVGGIGGIAGAGYAVTRRR